VKFDSNYCYFLDTCEFWHFLQFYEWVIIWQHLICQLKKSNSCKKILNFIIWQAYDNLMDETLYSYMSYEACNIWHKKALPWKKTFFKIICIYTVKNQKEFGCLQILFIFFTPLTIYLTIYPIYLPVKVSSNPIKMKNNSLLLDSLSWQKRKWKYKGLSKCLFISL